MPEGLFVLKHKQAVIYKSATYNVTALQLFQVLRFSAFMLLSIAFAKLGFSTAAIGSFEQFIFYSGLASFFWLHGLVSVLLVQFTKQPTDEAREAFFQNILAVANVCSLCMALLAFGLVFLFHERIAAELEDVLLFAIFFFSINTPTYLMEYYWYLNKHHRWLLLYGMANFAGILLLGALPAYFYGNIQYAMLGLLGFAFARLLLLLSVLRWPFGALRHLDLPQMKQIVLGALPFTGTILVAGSTEFTDSFIIQSFFSVGDFAMYRYGARELPLVLLITSTFSNAMIPIISTKLHEGAAELRHRSSRMMHLFFPLSIVAMLISHWVFPLVFNPQFAASAGVFNVYLLLAIPRLLFPHTLLAASGYSAWLFKSSVAEVVVNVACSLLLLPFFGLTGVAMGTVIAFVFDKVFCAVVLYQKTGIRLQEYTPVKTHLAYSLLLLTAFAFSMFMR